MVKEGDKQREGRPQSRPGYPLITPNALLAIPALGGLTLTFLAAFAPDSLAPPLKIMAFPLLQNPNLAVGVAVGALAIHVVEAVGVAIVGFRRGYEPPAVLWWASQAFLMGFPAILAMNQVQEGKAEEALRGGFHFRVSD